MSSFTFKQDIFPSTDLTIHVRSCHQTELHKFLPTFLKTIEDNGVGLAPIYGSKGRLTTLAIASEFQVIVVKMAPKARAKEPPKQSQNTRPDHSQLQVLDFLCQPTICKYAFEMDKLATALFLDCGIHIVAAKDLLSVSPADRCSLDARLFALGGEGILLKAAVKRCFQHEETSHNDSQTVALQAWAACHSASLPHMRILLEQIPSINTLEFDKQVLQLLSKAIRDGERLMRLKPIIVKNDIRGEYVVPPGGSSVGFTSERYKTRIMITNYNQIIKITTKKPDGKTQFCVGRVVHTNGRGSKINLLRGNLPTSHIHSVNTIGKELPNSAQALRSWVILNALQGIIDFSTHSFFSKMWFGKKVSWATTPKLESTPLFHFSGRELNISQKKAVNAILSNEDTRRIVMIHGPPGTGKTTVIAAAVTSFMASEDKTHTVWLVAQSNVAVKNIAEKLASMDFYDFKILVSKEFHYDWHEHLYEKIERNVIRSDNIGISITITSRQLLGSRVILCTLSMLSNDMLAAIIQLVPLQTVMFDEASQIEIGDYLPLLARFRPALRKLVFIGDDKQLAPYGTSNIPDLESIFEKHHLRENAVFLDTQYRMPIPIGGFISKHVYDKKLKSEHLITDPGCCRFVNVSKGLEVQQGHSWKNIQEVDIAIAIARQLTADSKSFRIITPYDPQRNLLENGLKDARLPWEDKCFNIDSFQGNEDDYIIISLVRSAKLGFLHESRRANVMLTRCKKSMIICTSRKFIEGPATNSLVGKLSKFLPSSAWLEDGQVQNGVRPFT